MSIPSRPPLLEYPTQLRLMRPIDGHIQNEVGEMVPQTLPAGTLVSVSRRRLRERQQTGTCLSTDPVTEFVYLLMKYKMERYVTGYQAGHAVKKTSPIPHTILSPEPGGAVLESDFYEPGEVLFLLRDLQYEKGDGSGKAWFRKGDAIVVTSSILRSASGKVVPREPLDAVYCFQNAFKHTGERYWVSDHYYAEAAFQLVQRG